MNKKPLVRNSTDPEQIENAEARERVAVDTAAADLRTVLGTDEGRRVVWSILERSGLFRTSFDGTSRTYFAEGMRNIGLMVLADIRSACPERLVEMMTAER